MKILSGISNRYSCQRSNVTPKFGAVNIPRKIMVEILNDEVRTERKGKVLLITIDRPPVNGLVVSLRQRFR
jgi:hypothetical protein